jgi:hypothetical protein
MLYESLGVERIFDTPTPWIGWFYCGYGGGADDVHTMWKGKWFGFDLLLDDYNRGIVFCFSFSTTTHQKAACVSVRSVSPTYSWID